MSGTRFKFRVENWITLATLLIIFLAWYEVTRRGVVPKIFIPSPYDVWQGFEETIFQGYHGRGLFYHCMVSLGRVLLGWLAACVVAIPLGLAMGLSSKVRAVFDYLIEFYRPLPPLAYYTLLVLWFGIGEFSKILLLFLAAIPPLTIGAVEGVKEVSPSVIQAARSLGADSRQVFCRIILPATTPAIITSMRISLGLPTPCWWPPKSWPPRRVSAGWSGTPASSCGRTSFLWASSPWASPASAWTPACALRRSTFCAGSGSSAWFPAEKQNPSVKVTRTFMHINLSGVLP